MKRIGLIGCGNILEIYFRSTYILKKTRKLMKNKLREKKNKKKVYKLKPVVHN